MTPTPKRFSLSPPMLRAVLCLVLGLAALGCAAKAAEHREVLADDPLLLQAELDTARGIWTSAPFSHAPWIPMGSNGTLTIHHGLGRTPIGVQVYLSYTSDDTEWDEPRRFTPAAGDVANVLSVTDEQLMLTNNTRGEFYLRVLLQ